MPTTITTLTIPVTPFISQSHTVLIQNTKHPDKVAKPGRKSLLRSPVIAALLFLAPFFTPIAQAITVVNPYVKISTDSEHVEGFALIENDFYGTVYRKGTADSATIGIQAINGYELMTPSSCTIPFGGSHTYQVRSNNSTEEIYSGEIVLPKVDIQFETLTEETEETPGGLIGYAQCADGYDSNPCAQRLRHVSIQVSPVDKPKNAHVSLQFPGGHLLVQGENQLEVAQSSYPIDQLNEKTFYLHGHTFSSGTADCTLRAVHSVSESEDVLRYTSAHATFTVVSEPFETNSTQTALSASGTTLIDNRTAIVTITLHGIDNPSEHSYQLRAVPDQAEGIVNKYGTDVFFSPTSDPLVWRTSKIYWYGKNPGQCCASYRFPYHFSLSVDDGLCGSEASYPVQMPENEDPCMYGDVEPSSESIIHEPEQVPGVTNQYRCRIEFKDFHKTARIVGLPTTDQYAEETEKEEEFHKKQWLGTVPTSQGGQGDCFTAEGLIFFAGFTGNGPYYVYGNTPEEAKEKAKRTLNCCNTKEYMACSEIWNAERGFIELKAKEHAGYNAAWKYHCTYEEEFGSSPQNHAPVRSFGTCKQD